MKKHSTINDTEQFKRDDSGSYDSYADDYHHCVDKLCEPFVKQMVKLAHLRPGQRVLDVGTGSGNVANYVAKLLSNSGSVVGIDFSEGMLKVADFTAKNEGLSNIQFVRMDAENLALPTGLFDSIISLRAVQHFPNATHALKDMYRCLKPGGRLVVGIGCGMPPWGGGRLKAYCVGSNRKIRQQFEPHLYAPNFILQLVHRHLGHLPAPPHSSWGGTNPGKNLLKLIKAAGFNIKDLFWMHNVVTIQTPDEFWSYQSAIVTEVRKRLMDADLETKESFYFEFKKLTDAALSRGGKLYYCDAAFIISSIRQGV